MMQDNAGTGEDGQTHAQRSANLARIRDNQRRSRARRKDYLQELESRYRACEQSGIEASAQIQSAAKKVVEENKKLRMLLKQTGMTDAEINAMLGDESLLDPSQHTSNATTLESLLGVKRSCGSNSSCSPSQSSEIARPTQTSKSSLPDPIVHSRTLRQSPLPAQERSPVSPFHSARTASTSSRGSVILPPNPGYPPSFPQQSRILPFAPNPHHPFEYETSPDNIFTGWQAPAPSYQYLNSGASDATSCYVAADVLRTLKPDAGFELEQQLGCGDGMDCIVPNTHIFDLMDHYSEQGRG